MMHRIFGVIDLISWKYLFIFLVSEYKFEMYKKVGFYFYLSNKNITKDESH